LTRVGDRFSAAWQIRSRATGSYNRCD
jgi:hypothetical protein